MPKRSKANSDSQNSGVEMGANMLKILVLLFVLFIPSWVYSAEETGTLADLKTATGTDSASTNCCDIKKISFHIELTGTATVAINCSTRANGGNHLTQTTVTADAIWVTEAPCTNIQSDVTSYTSGTVTVDYKVIR